MVVALLSVAIGATILSGLVSIYYDVPRQMGAEFRNYGANMIFTAADGEMTLSDVESAAKSVSADQLVGMAPFRYENVRINDIPVVATGTVPEGVKATSPYWSVEGGWFTGDGQLMVGANVADSFRIKTGDMIEVTYTPTDENGVEADLDNSVFFTVTGILETGGSEEDYIYMTLDDLAALTETDGRIDVAELSISATADELKELVSDINAVSGAVNASLVKRVTASEATVLTKLQALVLLVTVVVLLLTLVCVGTTMTEVVSERRKEIGLKKALGADNRNIAAEFFGESCMLGLLGGILGTVCGYLFAQAVGTNVFGRSLHLSIPIAVMSVLLSIVVTAIATMLPVRTAVKVEPAIVMRGE